MVNTGIQANIPLAGVGQVSRRGGGYAAGEYKQLFNCELDDHDGITNRRNLFLSGAKTPIGSNVYAIDNGSHIVGNIGDAVIAWGKGLTDNRGTFYVNYNLSSDDYCQKIWFKVDSTPASVLTWKPEYIFWYNNKVYIVAQTYNSDTTVTIRIYSADGGPTPLYGYITAWSNFTEIAVLSTNYTSGNGTNAVKKAFVHKERLWLVFDQYLVFSKPTDFSVWTVPDGGFFRFPESNVNSAAATGDNIFIVSDSSAYILNYSADPNVDASLSRVDDSTGGDDVVIFRGAAYYYKNDVLYSLNVNTATKITDLNLGITAARGAVIKLATFGDYIIVLIRNFWPYPVANSRLMYEPINYGAVLNQYRACYFVNMDLGSTHVFDVRNYAELDSISLSSKKYDICDVYVCPVESDNNNSFIWWMTKNAQINDDSIENNIFPSNYNTVAYMSYMSTKEPRLAECSQDAIWYLGEVKFTNHNIIIEIDSYTPDGSEALMKKFRNLNMEIRSLGSDQYNSDAGCINVQIAYDNKAYGTKRIVNTKFEDKNARSPYPVRFGLNQRARTINLLFTIDRIYSSTTYYTMAFYLQRLGLYWTYTQRNQY